jgi:hypothetical protein
MRVVAAIAVSTYCDLVRTERPPFLTFVSASRWHVSLNAA